MIVVAINRIARDKFGKKARKEELHPHKHHHQSDVENRVVSNERCTHIVVNVIQLVDAQIQNGEKSNHEHKRTECAEKVHRFFAKFCNKRNGKQIQKTIDKSVQSKFSNIQI